MTDRLIDHDTLRRVFSPRRIAVVGAKDGKYHFMGSGSVVQALERLGYDGELYMVNRSGTPAFGRPATTSVTAIGKPVDMAALAVPASAIMDVLPDIAAAGVKAIATLAAGFAETGEAGARAQQQVVEFAARHGITIIGPNCLGFANFAERTGVWFSGLPEPIEAGHVALISQSGGIGDAMAEYAQTHGIGLSHLITTGNEPMITSTDALAYAVEHPDVRVVAMFTEGIKKPAEFARIALRARELRKAILILKAGASEIGARNAISHTGSMVGDDRVMAAAFAQFGVIRVRSLEDLVTTAHLIANIGPLGRSGVGVVALSGGACSILADAAEEVGLHLPDLDDATTGALREFMVDFAALQNPLDVTGAADEDTFEKVLKVIAGQPDIGLLAVLCNVSTHESGATENVTVRLESIGRGMRHIATPSVLISQTTGHFHPFSRQQLDRAGIDLALPGLFHGTSALQHLSRWSTWLVGPEPMPALPADVGAERDTQVLSEWQARELLADRGVPIVPGVLVRSADAARSAPGDLVAAEGTSYAVKIVSPDIAHKSDIGAVALKVPATGLAEAYERVTAAARRSAAGADLTGVLVTPMRGPGPELVVGVNRDPHWGLTLVIGLGGIWVELLNDSALRVLPVRRADVATMLGELKGASLLRGARGTEATDIDAVVDAVHAIAGAAMELGDDLQSLEVNPLRVTPAGVEALDALAVMRRPS